VQSGKKSKKANRLWRIDPSKLKPGDVLLERAPTAKSLAIRAATRGEYSHALIWMGNSDFMESVGDGVQPMPYARIVTADPSRWTLLRLNSNRRAATAAATHVRSHSFKNYNLGGAITPILPASGSARSTTLFCSQLVVVAYKSAGVDLCPGKEPSTITPADLQNHSVLEAAPTPFTQSRTNNMGSADLRPVPAPHGSGVTRANAIVHERHETMTADPGPQALALELASGHGGPVAASQVNRD
jgi:uncharacterized protein YycO